MTWAARRRVIIVLILGGIALAILAFVTEAVVYNPPSCRDETQNQGETGVDCGGPCAYLCTYQQDAPVIRFTQTVTHQGRIDIVSYIDNPNKTAASVHAPYAVTVYDAHHQELKSGSGVIDLPPGGTVPLYLPSFYIGSASGAQAFVTVDPAGLKWFTVGSKLAAPQVSNTTLGGTLQNPRVTALLSNGTDVAFSNLKIVATLFDAEGNVITASQTLVPRLSPGGSVRLTFTWNEPLVATPARIEVLPVASLSP